MSFELFVMLRFVLLLRRVPTGAGQQCQRYYNIPRFVHKETIKFLNFTKNVNSFIRHFQHR